MRINQFVARTSGLSRRAADAAINARRITINGQPAKLGQVVSPAETVKLDGQTLSWPEQHVTIMLNKPIGYVVSRDGQGSLSVYDLLPPEFQSLKPVGRLDKNSSGLLLLTNDGQLAQKLAHPKFAKEKVYQVELDKPLTPADKTSIEQGVKLEDGLSSLEVAYSGQRLASSQNTERSPLNAKRFIVRMHEGRNRQIRRTFAALGYKVIKLHRTQFGEYKLSTLKLSKFNVLL